MSIEKVFARCGARTHDPGMSRALLVSHVRVPCSTDWANRALQKEGVYWTQIQILGYVMSRDVTHLVTSLWCSVSSWQPRRRHDIDGDVTDIHGGVHDVNEVQWGHTISDIICDVIETVCESLTSMNTSMAFMETFMTSLETSITSIKLWHH